MTRPQDYSLPSLPSLSDAGRLNQECVEKLTAAGLPESKYVAVVGAGLSHGLFSTTSELILQMMKRCKLKPRKDEYSWNFFQRAYDKDANAYREILLGSFGVTSRWLANGYNHLVTMPFRSLVTLNYDDQLPSAFGTVIGTSLNEHFSVYPPPPNLPKARLAQPTDFDSVKHLVAIHGFRVLEDPRWTDHIILKTDDYDRHYTSADFNYVLYNWWKDLLTRWPCVFVGTSLQEPGLFRVIDDLLKAKNSAIKNKGHLQLVPFKETSLPDGGSRLDEPVPPFGVIRPVCYHKIDEHHSGLLKVLSAFSRVPMATDFRPGLRSIAAITPEDKFPF